MLGYTIEEIVNRNFNKFLIGPSGEVMNRFSTRDEPTGETVTAAIEAALK